MPPQAMPPLGDAPDDVEALMSFFSSRLLLKPFRPSPGVGAMVEPPLAVRACEAAFRELAERAVRAAELGEELDALEWLDVCAHFSAQWFSVCHWLSPKRLREFFGEAIGVSWKNVDAVPADREQPPVDLKLYKNPEAAPAQPYLCAVCGVHCNSLGQYRAHTRGRAHTAAARRYGPGGEPDPIPVLQAHVNDQPATGRVRSLRSPESPSCPHPAPQSAPFASPHVDMQEAVPNVFGWPHVLPPPQMRLPAADGVLLPFTVASGCRPAVPVQSGALPPADTAPPGPVACPEAVEDWFRNVCRSAERARATKETPSP
eukprot:TRINITY_DN21580_c0_g1_i1.p1 TRINITY_DN21580_c0_g1~~TRINITY_DN21580_c0_g1_i1.p1  ORF type:complete len:332 (+),score=37.85 TRINITY_DN21580_c0_g1_i1:51-998(+)